MPMSDEKLLQVIDRYDGLCEAYAHNDEDLRHVAQMLPQMRMMLVAKRREKLMRWLGFVQGVLWTKRIYTLEELKEHNMPDDEREALLETMIEADKREHAERKAAGEWPYDE